MRTSHTLLAVVLSAVAALAALAREVHNERITHLPRGDASAGWFSYDPDTHYHLRRLARLLDEGQVDGRDAALNHPEGAAIPWPPYYTRVLALCLAPFAPEGSVARAAFLERRVSSLPWLFGTLTAVLAAWAAWRAAAREASRAAAALAAAACAGALFALLGSAVHYGAPGNGDHHAFATLLMALLFALVAEVTRPAALDRARRGALLGVGAGAATGLLLGAWVGGLVHLALAQLALGVLLVATRRERARGLVAFGLALHLTAALVLLPAVAASPWNATHPWIVVNLSWFHEIWLLCGALVFAPLAWLGVDGAARRRWPWTAAGSLLLAGALLAAFDAGPARGVRAGFAWAARSNGFMDYIVESQPIAWGPSGGAAEFMRLLGPAALLLLPAWVCALIGALRGRRELWIWVVAAPPLLVQALVQRRFADALGPTLAVLAGFGLAQLLARRARPLAPILGVLAGLAVGCALEYPTLARGVVRVTAGEHWLRGPQAATLRAQRGLYAWFAGERAGPGAVLAAWYHGHGIEWVGGRATLATNFGSYVGEAGYLAPWRFLLERDPALAEAQLAEHDARFVLIDGGLTNDLEVMLRALARDDALVARTPAGPRPSALWYESMGARLAFEGRAMDPTRGTAGESLDFMRLVHIASEPHRLPLALPYLPPDAGLPPAGWIWERVPGLSIEAFGTPGEVLEVTVEIAYPGRERTLVWSRSARCDGDGRAHLRVPYATDAPNGDGEALGPARVRLGGREQALVLKSALVLTGGRVEVR